jgi:hypothetical protein
MARSEVEIHNVQNTAGEVTIVDIDARGGTRRERGAAIAAAARNYGKPLKRVRISYSETYGFLPASYARYEITR